MYPGFDRQFCLCLKRFKINGRRLGTFQNSDLKLDGCRVPTYTTFVVFFMRKGRKTTIARSICLLLQPDWLHAAFHKRGKRVFLLFPG